MTIQTINKKRAKIVDNSYLLTVREAADNTPDYQTDKCYQYRNLLLFQNFVPQSSGWHAIENDDFAIFLDGNFYLNLSETIDSQYNLYYFFRILILYSLPVAINSIAGGLFNIIIIDKSKKQMTVFGDRMGLTPLFYAQKEGAIYLTGNQFNLKTEFFLSRSALVEFLKYGYLPAASSLLDGVHRLNPGQILVINLQNNQLDIRQQHLPGYEKPEKRLNNPDHSASLWMIQLAKFFSRLRDTESMIGLSGGYDSRLITAFMRDQNPKLLNFGLSGSPETRLAKEVSRQLNLHLKNDSFPSNLIARHALEIISKFRVLVNLENVHVMHLYEKINENNPDIYVDGFLGDAILGDTYYYKKGKSLKGLFRYLFALDNFDHKKKSYNDYVEALYNNDKEALCDEELKDILTYQDVKKIKNRFRLLVIRHSSACCTHEDMMERLTSFTRGKNLIAAGPVGVSSHTDCAMPFTDYDIMELAMRTDKKVRSNNSLYNVIWQNYFPQLANIRKAGNFGKAADSDFLYRLKHIFYILFKKIVLPVYALFRSNNTLKEESYFSNESYLKDPATIAYISEVMETGGGDFPQDIHRKLKLSWENGRISSRLLIRYVSLLTYLKETK